MTNFKRRILEGQFYRAAEVRGKIDEKRRTVEVSFSSEEPYRRWFGVEILGHKSGEVDMTFMASGRAPVLLDHDHKQQIAVIEKAWIGADGKGRALIRFSKSAKAEEIYQDVIDGIRSNFSVGYEITDMEMTGEDDNGVEIFRMKWRPFEASLVSIPADTSVGVGRSNQNQNQEEVYSMNENLQTTSSTTKINDAIESERARTRNILALGEQHGFNKEAAEAVQKGTSVDGFRAYILGQIEARGQKPIGNFSPEEGAIRQRQGEEFRISDYIASQIPGSHITAERELEISRKLTKELGGGKGRKVQGALIPIGSLTRGLVAGTATAGGHAVAENLLAGQFVEILRARNMIMNMGATVFTDLVGDVAIPKQDGTVETYWLGEDEEVTDSDASFGIIRMTPHTVAARTSYSRQFLLQSSIDPEQFVRNDLAKALAGALDRAIINGSGVGDEPLGILNTSGIGAVVGGDNGLAPTYAHVVGLWGQIAADNADAGSVGFLTNTKVVSKLLTTDVGTDTGKFVIENLPGADGFTKAAGMRCGVSNNVPSNLTKGNANGVCSAILCGVWSDLMIGMWGGLDIIVDPYSDSKSGKVWVTAFLSVDKAIRNAESFAAMKDALTTM